MIEKKAEKSNNNVNIKVLFVIVSLLSTLTIAGCSCGKKNGFTPEIEKSHTYDADAESDKLRRRSLVQEEVNGKSYYSTFKGNIEKLKEIEKIETDGKKALRNKTFVDAEKLYSQGQYEEAQKYYSSAASLGSNEYIKRRALNCELTIKQNEAKNDNEIKKAYSLFVEKRSDEALKLLDNIEKSSKASSNVYVKQRISNLKSSIYDNKGDELLSAEETVKSIIQTQELHNQLNKSWTMPVGRD